MGGHDVERAASRASDNPALEGAARAGFVVSGLLHLLIAWIALQVALGGSGGKQADQSGALSTLAGNGLGRALLWLAVTGFLGLALWQLAEAVAGPGAADRLKAGGKLVVYLALAWSAFSFARGSSRNSRSESVDFTATALGKPGGRVVVILVGLGVLAVGGYHVYKGWAKKFLEDLKEHPGGWATGSGRVGYIAKGAALAIVGVLFVAAGIHKRAKEAAGLDGALKSLLDQPLGTPLLVAMALGIAAYGLYSLARARYAKV
ncbi:MAG TPA: DUF1206 domain-containing protein [Pedococcus sp.]|jgi:hypothetical protein|nr:DUF1206 domain-containing protein [Pedococcus sp.]